MPDRLLVDLGGDGQVTVSSWPDGGFPKQVSRVPLTWPLDADALEDLRWYLEDYLLAPYGVWEDRGPAIRDRLADWGGQVFGSVFGDGPARDAYQRARDRGLELVFRSAEPALLGLPWELMRDGAGPVALSKGGISRSLPVADGAGTLEVPGGKLRVLMVISRPAGEADMGYQMVARPLLERLDTVRGEVELTVLRPPTFKSLRQVVQQAADAGRPFHIVHFDGHGATPGTFPGGTGESVLAFELPGGGTNPVGASKIAEVLASGKVPVVVLNACQSGAVGKELEASVATALLKSGCAAVVAMAYSVYSVAAADFMAAFYESLFAGQSVGQAVTSGRKRLFNHDTRPSPKGDMPLADWVVPVHYLRREVCFSQARTARPSAKPSLDEALDQISAASTDTAASDDPLAPIYGVFIGRDDLFYQLETAARLQHVVVLTGPGGTGKTELAKGFARWWRDTGGVSDPRLVFWHSFEPGVASFGLDGVITSLGLKLFGADFARQDPPQRLELVKQRIAQCRMLLIWDNFESIREMPDPAHATPPLDETGCDGLKDFLEWVRDHSHSAILITSRAQEAWLGQVHRIAVGGLGRAEAARYAELLLSQHPNAQQCRERRSFGDLLDWLDGHPLAMRLTLPRLDTTAPEALLSDLQGITPLPVADRFGIDRLSSLSACITYSFAHLSEQTKRLLPALSLFRGTASAAVLTFFSNAEGVPGRFAQTSVQDWLATLEDAAQVGLLTGMGIGIYRIHPALPSYLAAGWHADHPDSYDQEQSACAQALCTACAILGRWLARQIESGDVGVAYTLTGLQRRTLGAMLGYALDHHAWDSAEGIVRALEEYWESRGLVAEAVAWADRIFDAAATTDHTPPEAYRSLWLYTTIRQAVRQTNAGQLDQAEQACRRALAYLESQTTTKLTQGNTAVFYHQLGQIAQKRGRLIEAGKWYRGSLAIEEELGNRTGMASIHHELGRVEQDRGQLSEAEKWYRRSLAISDELSDRPGVAMTCHQLGVVVQNRGRLAEAEEWYCRSLAINEELGNRPAVALTYHQLGNTTYLRGRLAEADEWYRRSLAINEEVGNRPGVGRSYHQLGMTAGNRGRLVEAEEWYRRSLTIEEELGNRPGMASTYHELGRIVQNRGRLTEAEEWYRKSLAIKEELGNRPGMARTSGQLALLAEARDELPLALEWMVRCVALRDELPDPATSSGRSHLARLTRQLGMSALEQTWQGVTGQPAPQAIRDYITNRQDEPQEPPS